MKLFLKDHVLLIIVQLIQFSLIMMIYWLDGYHTLKSLLYGSFIGVFLLLCYLIYYYYSRKSVYKKLTKPLESLEETLYEKETVAINQALNNLLKQQYFYYESQLNNETDMQKEHMLFLDRWIHQMKTPLSVIELTAQTVDEPESSDIREEIDQMKSGLQTILYMSRLRQIEADFHIAQINLTELIKEVVGENKRYFIRSAVYPKLEIEDETIKTETDEKWLYFIITQIIQNAVKYSAHQSDEIKIKLSNHDGEIQLDITDFGVGISEIDLKRIYEPFYTGQHGRNFRESTGVGLYLVKKVCDYLNHEIKISSVIDQGTTVRIRF